MNPRILVLLIAIVVMSCDDNQTGITPNPRAFRTSDTLTIWEYKAPPPGRTAHRNLMLASINDSIWWTTMSDESYWIYLYFGVPDSLEKWEFAYTSEHDFDKINAPELYSFYGRSNFALATAPTPQHWTDGAVRFNVHDSPIILARRTSNPYPVFALRGYSLLVRPQSLHPDGFFQEYGIVCQSYY